MVYGRFGNRVTILRLAKIEDVAKLEGRKPDKRDREAIANDSYVIVTDEDSQRQIYHQAFLRADGGAREISAIIEACKKNGGNAP